MSSFSRTRSVPREPWGVRDPDHARSGDRVERRLEHSQRLGATMNRDLGVWTSQDCALVLIDYQKEIFATIRSATSADLVELNVRLLARTAQAFNMPIVLSTVGVAAGINGPTRPAILSELPGVQVLDRTTMNAFEDRPFREAVKKTGRRGLRVQGTKRATLLLHISNGGVMVYATQTLHTNKERSTMTVNAQQSQSPTSTDRIEKHMVLRAPRARVWRALTIAEQFGAWFRVKLEGVFPAGETIPGRLVIPASAHVTLAMLVYPIHPNP